MQPKQRLNPLFLLAAVCGLSVAASVVAAESPQKRAVRPPNVPAAHPSVVPSPAAPAIIDPVQRLQGVFDALTPAQKQAFLGKVQPQAAPILPPGVPPTEGAIDAGMFGGGGVSPTSADMLIKVQKLLANPWVQRYMRLYSDPRFMQSLEKMATSPDRMNLLFAEMGLVFLIFIIRTWRSTKVKGFMSAVWLRMWTFGVWAVIAMVVLPSYLLGDAYAECINIVYKTFTS